MQLSLNNWRRARSDRAQTEAELAALKDEGSRVALQEAARRHAIEREQRLAAARDRPRSAGGGCAPRDEERLAAEQKLAAAARAHRGHAAQGAGGAARGRAVRGAARRGAAPTRRRSPEALKAGRGPRALPAEISALQQAIAELGAVNLAALDELAQRHRAQGLPRRAGGRPRRGDGDARERDPADRPRVARAAAADVRGGEPNFGKLFPALFGGGQARLVLTGEEILDSGVQVVAQPPGKRNTSIHLLSGGEKALTAIALVFALFQLNPAPFCLLDEVDAPLDDTNTERFCSMVREMAARDAVPVHLPQQDHDGDGRQLIGITMPEPGVSRVVAVDIEEALPHPGSGLTGDGNLAPMSDLQLGLIVVGCSSLVVGVIVYNRWQEAARAGAGSKARSRSRHGDGLRASAAVPPPGVERRRSAARAGCGEPPRGRPRQSRAHDRRGRAAARPGARAGAAASLAAARLDPVRRLRRRARLSCPAGQPAPNSRRHAQALLDEGLVQPVHWEGYDAGPRALAGRSPPTAAYPRAARRLLLADRAGPLARTHCSRFCGSTCEVALALAAPAEFAGTDEALARRRSSTASAPTSTCRSGCSVIGSESHAFSGQQAARARRERRAYASAATGRFDG